MSKSTAQLTDQEHLARLIRQDETLQDIARLWCQYEGDLEHALQEFTEAAAHALAVERASVWSFNPRHDKLQCDNLFEATPRRHSHGIELNADDCPAYFAAVETENFIHAGNAVTDTRTREFTETYLRPNGIGAMLDAPIRAGGRLAGILCLEHVGGERLFHADEIGTATYLAVMLGAAYEFQLRQNASRHTEELLHDETALWNIFFEESRDGIVILNHDGSVYLANKRYADMLGYSMEELHKLHVWDWDAQYSKKEIEEMLRVVDPTGAHFDTRQRRKDGTIINVELSNNGALYKGRKVIFCICRDITQRKIAEEQLRILACTDDLTGIANRKEFIRVLKAEIERASRYDTPLSLVMYDLDHFKQVNDNFGHNVGDDVLRTVARLVNENIRSIDVAGRWGGEEFMVLLPQSNLAAAMSTAEKLRKAIAGHRFDKIESATASFGVAQFTPQEGHDKFLKRVDEALYQAKSRGRNRVETVDVR